MIELEEARAKDKILRHLIAFRPGEYTKNEIMLTVDMEKHHFEVFMNALTKEGLVIIRAVSVGEELIQAYFISNNGQLFLEKGGFERQYNQGEQEKKYKKRSDRFDKWLNYLFQVTTAILTTWNIFLQDKTNKLESAIEKQQSRADSLVTVITNQNRPATSSDLDSAQKVKLPHRPDSLAKSQR